MNYTQKSTDKVLVEGCKKRNRLAQKYLYQRYYGKVLGISMRYTGHRSEAEDVAQDAMMRLWKIAPQWRQGEAQVTTWLYRVAVNAAHDRRRKRATYMKATTGWGDWEIARTETNKDTAEQIDWLTAAMNQLTDDLRDTLALVLDDMTHAQTAEILGVTEGTISWRISEAKKALRAIKEKEDAL